MFKEDVTQYCKNCYELEKVIEHLKNENHLFRITIKNRNFVEIVEQNQKYETALNELAHLAREGLVDTDEYLRIIDEAKG